MGVIFACTAALPAYTAMSLVLPKGTGQVSYGTMGGHLTFTWTMLFMSRQPMSGLRASSRCCACISAKVDPTNSPSAHTQHMAPRRVCCTASGSVCVAVGAASHSGRPPYAEFAIPLCVYRVWSRFKCHDSHTRTCQSLRICGKGASANV